MKLFSATAILFLLVLFGQARAQGLDEYRFRGNVDTDQHSIANDFRFNGYTNYWHDLYRNWIRHGNLFKLTVPDVPLTIAQGKVDIASDIGISGLELQEGFVQGLLSAPYALLDQPSLSQIAGSSSSGNILVLVSPDSDAGKKLLEKLPEDSRRARLSSHQFSAVAFIPVKAFVLESGSRKIFVVSSASEELRNRLVNLIDDTKAILSRYDLRRGWFGAETLLKSVTCTPGHPLEVIGKGMNEGNTWFNFSGYMDFLAQEELKGWIEKVNLPIAVDVGFDPVYGCRDYEGLQVQSMFTKDSWINFAREKGGYVFRQVFDTLADPYHYDGYIAGEGNKEHIDRENVPFVTRTGSLYEGAVPCMVLFMEKGRRLDNSAVWEAILDRREVAVLDQGKMMGPARFRNPLQLLLLDRVYLEEYFGDRISLEARVTEGYHLVISLKNHYPVPVTGSLEIVLPPELKTVSPDPVSVNLPAGSEKDISIPLQPLSAAMDNANPVAVHFSWNSQKKSTLTLLDLPPAISLHRLMYGHAPKVTFPVTVHNFTGASSFPVKLEVTDPKNTGKVVFASTRTCAVGTAAFQDMVFELEVPAGHYQVKVSALGVENTGQLGVGKAMGKVLLHELDLNSDGVMEYRMENDSVQVTLLATGARVIEYIVRSRNDNILFKLWPEKAVDDKRAFRKRGYYPYGGFEDFLGQGSMETHKVYDAEVLKKEGDYVQVKMWADYFGNRLEKTFTLYGNSPLLEVRFALTFKNPEANVLGPQPILEIGERHWTEDVFVIPEEDGLHEYRMMPERYYGRVFFMREGWNAGYDTAEDITFVGAFPVTEPLFLHMWMNHPVNSDAHHYYAEFQPWTPIYQKSTMYFSYFIWGAGGPWQNGVRALRDRNLISTR
jgi:hypothetical protein